MPAFLPRIMPMSEEEKRAKFERSLISREAEIGGKLFGPVPKGHDRQFFCLDERTWVWHEQWQDQNKQTHTITTRYIIRPSGVIRSQEGQAYQTLSRNEARNLYGAIKLYMKRVTSYYDQMLQTA
jgi:hypothetical protein